MKERPILFSAPMVRAILDGSKTQTRRVVKLPVEYSSRWSGGWHIVGKAATIAVEMFNRLRGNPLGTDPTLCPYGQPGDKLWVRETFGEFIDTDVINGVTHELGRDFVHRADGGDVRVSTPWKPSIHMPRAASRILLEITSVRVERLQEISEADALAEGIDQDTLAERQDSYDIVCKGAEASGRATATSMFRELWESINGSGSWDTNPWVWVVTFKRVQA